MRSPLPKAKYDLWRGELSLIHPSATPLDETVRKVCKHFSQADAKERSRIRASISDTKVFEILIPFGNRSAIFALRQCRIDLVADGMTAMAMAKYPDDFRDISFVQKCLVLLSHVANKLGADPDKMFLAASAIADPKVTEWMTYFMSQTPEFRNLRDSWGYDEVKTEDGPGFIEWRYNPYDPTLDLKTAIIEISALMEGDKYQPVHISLAAEIPDVWLGGCDDLASKYIHSAIRASASVNAQLRPEYHPKQASQHFTVYLVEAANEPDAQSLCRMADRCESSYARLALAARRLFCLIVARSWWEKVDPYETNESLKRFSDGLASILDRHAAIASREH